MKKIPNIIKEEKIKKGEKHRSPSFSGVPEFPMLRGSVRFQAWWRRTTGNRRRRCISGGAWSRIGREEAVEILLS
jgi:hypothetical protein